MSQLPTPQLTSEPDEVVIVGRIRSTPHDTTTERPNAAAPAQVNHAPDSIDPSALKRPTSRFGSVNDLVDRLTPRVDPRDDDLTYRRILRDLQAEHPSDSMIVSLQLPGLAADFLQAARMREAIEQLQNFEVYEAEHLRTYEELRQSTADLHAVLLIVHCLHIGQSAIATPEAAK